MMTPKRNPHPKRTQSSKISENFNPNLLSCTPNRKPIKSPSLNSPKKSKKSALKTPTLMKTPQSKKSSAKRPKKDPNLEKATAPVHDPVEDLELEGSSKLRKMKSLMLEEAMSSIPEPGAGRVMHLVKAFERLLSLSKDREGENVEEKKRRVMNWALPGLHQQQAPRAEETEISCSWLLSSSLDFDREAVESSSVDSTGDRLSWGSSSSDCNKRSRSKV
ncbi:uncharacterized protein LOC109832278 [Asparagus officinalis]|uniref:uncharacterized protein LOC109832278 n=1 Tax=Asparagus officinalis TaxID=4686 RepID=UPI00098E3FAE|nr:uncharacterized protein LOC109832278 [Asparagus officinalis]